MNNYTAIRERYLQDSVPIRLGGLAANLRRIKSFAAHDSGREAVESLIDESKFFIEWTAPEAEIETAAQLVELQLQLAQWQRDWASIWPDPERRQEIAEQSLAWSDRVLALSASCVHSLCSFVLFPNLSFFPALFSQFPHIY